jgi:hypothetical protein
MIVGPTTNPARVFRQAPYVTDLEPAEQHMKVRRARRKTKAAVTLFHLPKPTEEEKNVSQSNALKIEVSLRRFGLSEEWSPIALACA